VRGLRGHSARALLPPISPLLSSPGSHQPKPGGGGGHTKKCSASGATSAAATSGRAARNASSARAKAPSSLKREPLCGDLPRGDRRAGSVDADGASRVSRRRRQPKGEGRTGVVKPPISAGTASEIAETRLPEAPERVWRNSGTLPEAPERVWGNSGALPEAPERVWGNSGALPEAPERVWTHSVHSGARGSHGQLCHRGRGGNPAQACSGDAGGRFKIVPHRRWAHLAQRPPRPPSWQTPYRHDAVPTVPEGGGGILREFAPTTGRREDPGHLQGPTAGRRDDAGQREGPTSTSSPNSSKIEGSAVELPESGG
jgi:hypothetical protein